MRSGKGGRRSPFLEHLPPLVFTDRLPPLVFACNIPELHPTLPVVPILVVEVTGIFDGSERLDRRITGNQLFSSGDECCRDRNGCFEDGTPALNNGECFS